MGCRFSSRVLTYDINLSRSEVVGTQNCWLHATVRSFKDYFSLLKFVLTFPQSWEKGLGCFWLKAMLPVFSAFVLEFIGLYTKVTCFSVLVNYPLKNFGFWPVDYRVIANLPQHKCFSTERCWQVSLGLKGTLNCHEGSTLGNLSTEKNININIISSVQ